MNDLRRELAPITDEAWAEIEDEARRTLTTWLASRKLVDFRGPLGWDHSAVNTGRIDELEDGPNDGVEAHLRRVQPLVELRVPFTLDREELDDVSRGAADPELDPLVQAARKLAYAEDRLVFYGYGEAGIDGICPGSDHEAIELPSDGTEFPKALVSSMETLRSAGIDGPYALALGSEAYANLATTVGDGGYPVVKHVQRLLEGPITEAPALEGGLLLSTRGEDFELIVGRDIAIGYDDHDSATVDLYLQESVTFRLLGPEAAVALSSA